MIKIIKNKIWELLKEKDVSLVMLYDGKGNILWHRGRDIAGNNVETGQGFSKTCIREAFDCTGDEGLERDGFNVFTSSEASSESFVCLRIKSLIIREIGAGFFLYIDSGTKESFSPVDREIFKVLGTILGETINKMIEKDTDGITGSSEISEDLRKLIVKYSVVDDPVLLTGETGTGKSYAAELIHLYSGRTGKFKVINTPGIPESLFESEMFGHVKGAFTDAGFDKKGLVEEAQGGTLFIDEIAEVPVSIQARLLRFIETGKYTMLGSPSEKQVEVRIVAATNKNLREAIHKKEFREDLYYRLNVFDIEIPPLRQRIEDINELVKANISCLQGKEIGEGFWESLYSYHWPGNIRELISVLKRAGVHGEDTLTGKDISDIIDGGLWPKLKVDTYEVNRILEEIKAGKNFWDVIKKPFLDRELRRCDVKQVIA
ncbi:MAG: sigma-54-dependent Fis family transcriptional regulator, partial [bacterium]|nr:sigma-54-dependent Fis family transcriptional regulator [bacterium]